MLTASESEPGPLEFDLACIQTAQEMLDTLLQSIIDPSHLIC